MKKIFAVLFVSLLILSCKQDQNGEAISYSITFDKDNIKVAKVKVEFTPKDSILFMDHGATNFDKGWATFIYNIKAVNDEGEPVELEEIPGAKWKINAPLHEKIVLTYDVHLDHEDYEWDGGIDGVAYTTDRGVFYTGRTLFIMNGEQRKNITVDFKLPPNWRVTTPWKNIKAVASSYLVRDNTDLANAMIFAGTHKEISLKRDDFEFVFALGTTEIINEEAIFQSLAEGVLDYYIELMGGIPRPSPDSPFKKMVVVISSHPSITDGEVIGNNISILIQKDADQFSKTISRFIFAHEFFHLWNGKSFRPDSENGEWFKEGLTNYYTLKALHHIGFLTDETYLDFLSNFFYKRYHDDNGLGRLAMANGEEKHEHWGLVYGGGMLAGIAQDMLIRDATNNAKSMDDLMRSLFNKYGNSNDDYTLEELKIMMSELSGIEQTEFFNSYVSGTEKIPIDSYLTLAGLDANIDNGNLIISKKEHQTQQQRKIMEGLFGQLKSER
ncbi:M61 family metallopeptidase [Pontibacter sp. H249]|uniref:M61 family metallopeptidase n=1 Tax=Pontibacter sp. H249 TaxID=3133420 RepID=UPI0030C2A929